ncbi:unnamed protein product [Closterium sp. Yama58-4]|nr:unnamed protein product [Closterium sp. Yama58-4]
MVHYDPSPFSPSYPPNPPPPLPCSLSSMSPVVHVQSDQSSVLTRRNPPYSPPPFPRSLSSLSPVVHAQRVKRHWSDSASILAGSTVVITVASVLLSFARPRVHPSLPSSTSVPFVAPASVRSLLLPPASPAPPPRSSPAAPPPRSSPTSPHAPPFFFLPRFLFPPFLPSPLPPLPPFFPLPPSPFRPRQSPGVRPSHATVAAAAFDPASTSSEGPINPLKVMSQPLKVMSQPLKVMSQPLKVMSQPLKVMSQPLKVMSQPLKVMSQPLKVMSQPLKVMSQPLKVMSQPLKVMSQPLKVMSQPLKVMSQPLKVMSQPLKVMSQPLKVMSQPLKVMSQPLKVMSQPLKVMSQPLKVMSQPLKVMSQPLKVMSQPLKVMSQPLKVMSQPLKVMSQPLKVMSQPLKVMSQPLKVMSQPLKVMSQPLKVMSQPLKVMSQPLKVMSQPLKVMSQPLKVMSQPLKVMSQPLKVMSQPLKVMSQPLKVMSQPLKVMSQPLKGHLILLAQRLLIPLPLPPRPPSPSPVPSYALKPIAYKSGPMMSISSGTARAAILIPRPFSPLHAVPNYARKTNFLQVRAFPSYAPKTISYKSGPVMSQPLEVYLIWHGTWPAAQKTPVQKFVDSISDTTLANKPGSVSDWWNINRLYKAGATYVTSTVSRSVSNLPSPPYLGRDSPCFPLPKRAILPVVSLVDLTGQAARSLANKPGSVSDWWNINRLYKAGATYRWVGAGRAGRDWWNINRLYKAGATYVTPTVSRSVCNLPFPPRVPRSSTEIDIAAASSASGQTPLTKADLLALINFQILSGSLPRISSAVYVIFTSADVDVDGFGSEFCAFHSVSGSIKWAWVGMPEKVSGRCV